MKMSAAATEYGQNIAADDLQLIIDNKSALKFLANSLRRQHEAGFWTKCTAQDVETAIAAMEEAYDDLLGKDYTRLVEISGSVEFPSHIPSVTNKE